MTGIIIIEYLIAGGMKSILDLLWGITPLLLFIAVTTWLFSNPETTVLVLLRIISGSLTFSFFVSFTNPSDLTRVLETLKIPPRWALIPSLTLSFVPRIIKDAQETLETLALRGEIGGKWNILKWLPKTLAVFIASTLYRSEFLAQALYFRGFGLPLRTHYRKVPFRSVDFLRILIWSSALIILPLIKTS
jgi:energy-coupling factor transporter transmembrane protein EcfT